MKSIARIIVVAMLCLIGFASQAHGAQGLLMARTELDFPEAMAALQQSITEHGYRVSRVQRVDYGLTRRGFETDRYRVVFFGKAEEIDELVSSHPEMIPFLPLKVVIFAEEDQTLVTAIDPGELAVCFRTRLWMSSCNAGATICTRYSMKCARPAEPAPPPTNGLGSLYWFDPNRTGGAAAILHALGRQSRSRLRRLPQASDAARTAARSEQGCDAASAEVGQ
jgi:uncharacterized protein (DUF302 family)